MRTAINYGYDADGAPMTITVGGITYYYALNLQGDVVAIINSSGNAVVEYTYDAWGNPLSATGSMAATLGQQNSLRYRGYAYDAETKLYYLQSRYYNPGQGRFLNADALWILEATPSELTDRNLFAYCDNNPVSRADDGGHFWNFVVGAVGGAMVGMGVQIVNNLVSKKDWTDGLGTAIATGAASGLLAASGVGLIGSIAGNATISMAGNATNQVIKNNGFKGFDVGDMLIDGVISGVAGAVGGSGMGKSANLSTLNRNLTKKVFSGSTQVAKNGAKYYLSQTKALYKQFLIDPILKAGAASAASLSAKALLW